MIVTTDDEIKVEIESNIPQKLDVEVNGIYVNIDDEWISLSKIVNEWKD